MADEQKIRVIRPDGRVSTIPLSSLPAAIKAKYRPAGGSFLPATPDSGSQWEEFRKAVSWQNQHPLAGVGRAVKNIAMSPLALAPRTRQELMESLMNPLMPGSSPSMLKRIALDPAVQLGKEGRSDVRAGQKEGYGKMAASVLPLVGPMASDLGKTAGTGDILGAGAEAGTYALAPKAGELAVKGFRGVIPKGSASQTATRPLVQKYLFDRSMSVQNMISSAAQTFDKMIGERWSRIESKVDKANPAGAIDASRLRAATAAAKSELIAAPQKLPRTVEDIANKADTPRVMGSKLDLSNPVHKGLYDRLVEEGALPSADKITWQEARQIRSKLGRELRGHSPLSGEAKALGWRVYDDLTTQMRDAAEKYGKMGNEFDLANKLHQQYMQDFVDRTSPLAKAIKGKNPHGILDPLSNPRFAEQARRLMAKYQDLGIKPELVSKEGNLFQKYKSGLPKQWEANRWEMTADAFTGGLPTGVRMTHNLLSRAKALRELQTPSGASSIPAIPASQIETPTTSSPPSITPTERPPTSPGGVVRSTEKSPSPEPSDSAKTKVNDYLTQAFIRKAQEAAGQDVLDTMSEHGESPIEVNRIFWDQTFDRLPPEVQKRFTSYLKKETGGMQPGDTIGITKDHQPIIAKSWADIANNILDLSHDPEELEGSTRGLVVLMRIALQKFKPGLLFGKGLNP